MTLTSHNVLPDGSEPAKGSNVATISVDVGSEFGERSRAQSLRLRMPAAALLPNQTPMARVALFLTSAPDA